MTNKEKEAIEEVKRIIKNSNFCDSIGTGQIETLLNCIDKLQKENEDMREELQMYVDTDIMKLQEENKELKEKYENINWYFENQKDNFVHKDKIRNKIKELEEAKEKEEYIDEYGVRNIPVLNGLIDLKIEVLKELLGDDE